VDAWAERYPHLGRFRDSDGRPPRHGWFFPGEEYRPHFLARLGQRHAMTNEEHWTLGLPQQGSDARARRRRVPSRGRTCRC
jgi:hypothetical protein